MNDRQAALVRDLELFRMKKMQAYIAIRGSDNVSENSDVPGDRMALYSRVTAAGAGLSRQQNALVRAALADAEHGAGGGHEHRGVREFVFRRLHDGLREDGARDGSAGTPDEARRPRPARKRRAPI